MYWQTTQQVTDLLCGRGNIMSRKQRFSRPEIAHLKRIEKVLHLETSKETNERALTALAFSNNGHYNVM